MNIYLQSRIIFLIECTFILNQKLFLFLVDYYFSWKNYFQWLPAVLLVNNLSTMVSDSDDQRTRYRRTQSVTRAEEITNHEQKKRKSQPDKPWVFLSTRSCFPGFSTRRVSSQQTHRDYTGGLNLWLNDSRMRFHSSRFEVGINKFMKSVFTRKNDAIIQENL